MVLKGWILVDADSGLLVKYFDVVVVEVEKYLLFFRLALAILWDMYVMNFSFLGAKSSPAFEILSKQTLMSMMPPPPPMPPIANAPRMGLLGQQLMTPPRAPITPRGSTRGKILFYILNTLGCFCIF